MAGRSPAASKKEKNDPFFLQKGKKPKVTDSKIIHIMTVKDKKQQKNIADVARGSGDILLIQIF